jgi:hypothetical protein
MRDADMRIALVLATIVIGSAVEASAQVSSPATPQSPSRGAAQTTPPAAPANPETGARNPAPSSAIGAPLPSLAPLPSMSSPITTTPLSSGGTPTSRSSSALSPGQTDRAPTGSGSASEAAASAPGGGGNTLADCMNFWDRGTHMTKAEWRAACKRTLARIGTVDAESKKSTKSGKTSTR